MRTPTATSDRASAVLGSYAEYLDWLESLLNGATQAAGLRDEGPVDEGAVEQGTSGPVFLSGRGVGERLRSFDTAPDMVVLPAGSFEMGAHPADPDAQPVERPRRRITLPGPLAVSVTPITFDQWDACLTDDGTRHCPPDATWGRGKRPVVNVSWHDAEEYVGWLSRKTGERYRLLSEAEWEYACWAGAPQTDRYPWGADLGCRQLRHHAWHSGLADLRTHPVGLLHPNAWGLLDMLGNVGEWVADAYHRDLHVAPSDGTALQSIARGASCVFKGGSWLDSPRAVRPSARDHFNPDHRSYKVGFRVAMELPQQP